MSAFTDAVAVVTGGGSGIGRETAIAFADRGTSVVVGDVAVEGGEETVSMIREAGGEAVFVEADVTDDDQVDRLVETAVGEYGRLDFGFNNAGIGGEQVPTAEYPAENWFRVLDVNLSGVFRCMQAELEQLLDQGEGGVIVNTASILGKVGFATAPAYTAAKHGVLGLTKVAALDHSAPGIRVNAVCPGFILTPMLEAGGITDDEEMRDQVEAMHPIGRLGEPEEVATAVVWLCSDDASFVTGEAIDVDGGYLSR